MSPRNCATNGVPGLWNTSVARPIASIAPRFITTTRRQMFLMPPRRNRAFPIVELG